MFFCMHPLSRFFPSVVLAAGLAFFLAGCGGGYHQESEPATALAPNGKPLPLMKAKESFFDGSLLAEITLSQSRGKGGFHAAPIHGLSSPDSDYEDDSNDDVQITQEMVDEIRARKAESPLPPIVMWLKLTNTAGNPLNVEVTNFNSELGNFAVQPDHVAIGPGQSAQPDPMISRLGVTSLEIQVTVSLRLNGTTETHVLTLRPVASAVKPPAAP
jgi:hypothetical protein